MRPWLLCLAVCGLTGCAGAPSCPSGGCTLDCTGKLILNAYPTSATADHSAAAPGNQQQFTVTEGETFYSPSGQICVVPAIEAVVHPLWTNPDPLDISISSANDATNGAAVCTDSTSGPVTLTGSVQSSQSQAGESAQDLTVSVQLTCK